MQRRIGPALLDIDFTAVAGGGFYQWWHSPQRVLGLFPEWFARPQPDWPPQTGLTGFPLFDDGEQEIRAAVEDFLAGGPPPIVFTRGSAMRHGRAFFAESANACTLLGHRAILLTRFREQVPANLPEEVGCAEATRGTIATVQRRP